MRRKPRPCRSEPKRFGKSLLRCRPSGSCMPPRRPSLTVSPSWLDCTLSMHSTMQPRETRSSHSSIASTRTDETATGLGARPSSLGTGSKHTPNRLSLRRSGSIRRSNSPSACGMPSRATRMGRLRTLLVMRSPLHRSNRGRRMRRGSASGRSHDRGRNGRPWPATPKPSSTTPGRTRRAPSIANSHTDANGLFRTKFLDAMPTGLAIRRCPRRWPT